MTDNDREQIALFRYGLIAPILNGQVENQKDYFAKVCGQVHQVPYYGPREFVCSLKSCNSTRDADFRFSKYLLEFFPTQKYCHMTGKKQAAQA